MTNPIRGSVTTAYPLATCRVITVIVQIVILLFVNVNRHGALTWPPRTGPSFKLDSDRTRRGLIYGQEMF